MCKVWNKFTWYNVFVLSKVFKRGNRSSFWPVLTLWGGGHIDLHAWRWAIVPLDLARSFGALCAHYCYRVIYRAITYMRVYSSPHGKGSSRLLGKLSYEKNPEVQWLTSISDSKMAATTDSPLNFLGIITFHKLVHMTSVVNKTFPRGEMKFL